jgi:hypothetical protein
VVGGFSARVRDLLLRAKHLFVAAKLGWAGFHCNAAIAMCSRGDYDDHSFLNTGKSAMKASHLIFGAVLALGTTLSAPSDAALIEFNITGTGSGSLNSTLFTNDAFNIQMVGDNSTVQVCGGCIEINPLVSATIYLNGFGNSTLELPTRLGPQYRQCDLFFPICV